MCKTYFHFQLKETEEQSEYEESLHSIPTRPASPSPSTSGAAFKTKPPASKKSKIDDLLIKFLDRPRPEELETIAAASAPAPSQPDERTSFSQWIAARMSRIPQDKWDDFQLAAMRLMHDYNRPSRPKPDTSPSPTAQPGPMPPVQQQWPHFPQQQQQWGQMQTWQQQWPQPKQQHWGASTQVQQQPSQQVWQQPSSSQPQIQVVDAPLHQPATAQPVRQTPKLGAPRSQSVPPVLDASINGTSLTDLFINQLIPSGNTSLVAASQAARPSGTQEDSEDD
ncbi:uncharacterized protein [Asterias amurensis]|uniref:uncharacterized protein n=1 Tax=Asterias amurensis TaxID=7602 RepID=UPI003AB8A398